MGNLTPMMQQYMLLKEKYKDCLIFYRLGDFYEMFFDDAVVASKALELTLTGRDCGLEERAPMCGVPHHAVDGYITKLIEKGHKVAICEQLTDPALSKGLVERDVVRVITAGTVIEDGMLEENKNNYILCIHKSDNTFGLSWADVSTGEFNIVTVAPSEGTAVLNDYIATIKPSELILNNDMYLNSDMINCLKSLNPPIVTCRSGECDDYNEALKAIDSHFHIKDESITSQSVAICAAGSLMAYLFDTQKNKMQHIYKIINHTVSDFMLIDASTRKNLELTEPIRGKGKHGTLMWLLDKTKTAMGGRELRSWVDKPLANIDKINTRLDSVDELKNNYSLRKELAEGLDEVYDIERLCCKISYSTVNARDCMALQRSLSVLPKIKSLLSTCNAKGLIDIYNGTEDHQELERLLFSAISPDAPLPVNEGGIIKEGYNSELDEMRGMVTNSKDWILSLEQRERETTGIKNLKIGFNRVFGYYIEVTKSYLDQVPFGYIRKQTLTNCERFVTEELKEMEEKLLGVEEKIVRLEYQLFCEIRGILNEKLLSLQETAHALATLDAYASLAEVASDQMYCKPEMHTGDEIEIFDGRHPVVEKSFSDIQFVPNDAVLDNSDNRFVIITGPNMAGKSTYMRQVALITLMAHIGSFVPARSAKISLTDRIFTRVGASDDLASGKSTFMVEMSEVANILSTATAKSLLIFDEIGRGTSTFDGLSIAWAVVEYVSDKNTLGAKTLFATHYHELSELEGTLDGIKNYSIAVKEHGDDVIFLRKIRRGSADKSFGIQVARLAGLPEQVLARATEILKRLEEADINNRSLSASIFETASGNIHETQMSIFDVTTNPIIEELKGLSIDNMSPIQAMNVLYELKDKAKRM